MAFKRKHPFFLTTKEFGEKVYNKFLESVSTERRDKVTLEMVNFDICFSSNQDETKKINLCNLYKNCFVDFYGKISADGVESLIDEFVTNSLVGLKGTFSFINDHDAGFGKIRKTIFPIVRRKILVDDNNKNSCALSAADHTIKLTFFPFRSLPDIGVCLATIEGSSICCIHRGMIKDWHKDAKSATVFKDYRGRDDQLNLILDLEGKDLLKEEIVLLRIAKENFVKLVKKKYKKGVNMWHQYPSNGFKAELAGQEYSNLSGSLLLLPELISASQLKVKGDIIVVAAEESTLLLAGAQEPLALCFIGDLAIELKDEWNFISIEPLRLVKNGGLWKWVHYDPNLEMKEFSVPNNKAQVDMIFKCITTTTEKSICSSVIPVFKNLQTPLTVESQEKLEQDLGEEKSGQPRFRHIPICWYCGCDDKKLKQCEGCLLARYCERKCQKAHWKMHKPFCKTRNAEKPT